MLCTHLTKIDATAFYLNVFGNDIILILMQN